MMGTFGYVILAIIGILVISYFTPDQEYQECIPLVKKCFKYIPSGGLFGGVSDKEVGCNTEYDFYTITNTDRTNTSCYNVYEKHFWGDE